MNTTVPHPIHLASPTTGLAPTSYLVILQTQHCSGCGRTHKFTEIYAKTNMRPQMGLGNYVTNLRPIHSISDLTWNLPIERNERPPHTIPFCHECHTTAKLSHLPAPPPPEARGAVVNHLAGTGTPTHIPGTGKTTVRTVSTKPTTKPKFGVDDL
jgi:hypothetical protein